MGAKGSYGSGRGAGLLSWTPVVYAMREYAEALEADGQPRSRGVTTRPDDQQIVDVFPSGCAYGSATTVCCTCTG